MKLFTWEGEVDTILSPMDSLKYTKQILHAGFMSFEPQTGYIKAWVGGINQDLNFKVYIMPVGAFTWVSLN